jgi:TetR/AcrR family transcriptional regulator, transcriptional repressor for nem operon
VRYPREQKAETRRRILDAAARLFRESGYDGVGVDAIMNEVGLTAGGFYSHFSSKEALFSEAMASALAPGNALRAAKNPGPSTVGTADPLVALIKGYLSRAHRDMVADGCPLPTLSPDVARKSEATRESYEQQFLKFVHEIEALLPARSEIAREHALSLIAQCVGGVMLSRAVKDRKLSDQILKSCRDAAIKISRSD